MCLLIYRNYVHYFSQNENYILGMSIISFKTLTIHWIESLKGRERGETERETERDREREEEEEEAVEEAVFHLVHRCV